MKSFPSFLIRDQSLHSTHTRLTPEISKNLASSKKLEDMIDKAHINRKGKHKRIREQKFSQFYSNLENHHVRSNEIIPGLNGQATVFSTCFRTLHEFQRSNSDHGFIIIKL